MAPISLSDADISRLLQSIADPRTAVLVRMLVTEGFGLGEILALDHDQIVGPPTAMSPMPTRHGRPTSIPLDDGTAEAISALQRDGSSTGPLMTSTSGGRGSARITRFGADYLIKQASLAAGLDTAISANVLRRSHVAAAQRRGVHIMDTRDRMGHQDVRTTHRHLAGGIPPTMNS
jgi:integrase